MLALKTKRGGRNSLPLTTLKQEGTGRGWIRQGPYLVPEAHRRLPNVAQQPSCLSESGLTKFPFSFVVLSWGELG